MSRPNATPSVADTGTQLADSDKDQAAAGEAEAYLERARAMRAALFARLERGQGERALSELDALHYEWSDKPEAVAAMEVLEAIRADFVAEVERREGRFTDDEEQGPEASPAPSEPDRAEQPVPPPLNEFVVEEDDPAPEASDPDPDSMPGAGPAASSDTASEDGDLLTPESMLPPVTGRSSEDDAPGVKRDPEDSADADSGDSASAGDAGGSTQEIDPDLLPSVDFARAVIAFVGGEDAELRRLSDTLKESGDPLAPAARGLAAFREDTFAEAMKLLRPAIHVDPTVRDTYLRSGLFLGRFKEIRQDMLADPDDVDPTLRALAFGPFHRSYPHAAQALEQITAEGHYRVMTDLGLTPRTLDELNGKLAEASPKGRVTLLRRTKKKHLGLQMLAQTMDKAYAAYDKLFGIDRTCELVPTVYMFADSSDFAAFSRRLEVGSTENTLGYYLPRYRVLVFYEEGDPKPGELSVETQETLMHETFHQWLHLYVKDAPPWFNEGLAEYFGICRIQRTRLLYGLVPAMTGPTRLANIRESLTGEGYYEPWPVKRVLNADHRDFMSSHPGLNYAQAWSFVHYLTSSKTGRERLRAYFEGLRDGVSTETLYRRVFGDVPAKSLEEDWKAYVLKLKPS